MGESKPIAQPNARRTGAAKRGINPALNTDEEKKQRTPKTDNRDAFASRLPLPPQQYVDFCRNFAMVPVPKLAREKIPFGCRGRAPKP